MRMHWLIPVLAVYLIVSYFPQIALPSLLGQRKG